jgi:hypothetical protein
LGGGWKGGREGDRLTSGRFCLAQAADERQQKWQANGQSIGVGHVEVNSVRPGRDGCG